MLFTNQTKNKEFIVYGLKNTYCELGEHKFKIVVSKIFEDAKFSTLTMVDSDGKAMKYNIEYWGRKMNASFFIDENVSDGIGAIDLILKKDENTIICSQRLFFWVIK